MICAVYILVVVKLLSYYYYLRGLQDDRTVPSGETVLYCCQTRVGSYRRLRPGDMVTLYANFDEGWCDVIINLIERIYRYNFAADTYRYSNGITATSVGNTSGNIGHSLPMDYIFGATLTEEDKLAIVPYSLPQLLDFHGSLPTSSISTEEISTSNNSSNNTSSAISGGLPSSLRHIHNNTHPSTSASASTSSNTSTAALASSNPAEVSNKRKLYCPADHLLVRQHGIPSSYIQRFGASGKYLYL